MSRLRRGTPGRDRAFGARAGLLLIGTAALIGALAVMQYEAAILAAAVGWASDTEAHDAFDAVRTANGVLLAAIVVGWTLLVRWLHAAVGPLAARRAIVPGPFGGEPARMLDDASPAGSASLRGTARLAAFAAVAWPLGLVASHALHPLALVVGVSWGAIAVVSWRLRAAVEQVRGR